MTFRFDGGERTSLLAEGVRDDLLADAGRRGLTLSFGDYLNVSSSVGAFSLDLEVYDRILFPVRDTFPSTATCLAHGSGLPADRRAWLAEQMAAGENRENERQAG